MFAYDPNKKKQLKSINFFRLTEKCVNSFCNQKCEKTAIFVLFDFCKKIGQ